ncbi:hypothetical protein [Geodermatophilus sabuli]|uniref:Lipoprotein n=1 Tax=Geodermatophilus sabuli TaxID=1564158 RepID=A0A285E5V1_9ACTN|nr:hypothetical protein [Geodermatophilus sabuli]MBB3082655.1 hypothetical protein [Geodermatophilus sabuli]SNX94479.1 hypothetical protein SAMN06893097_101273 [Geodermatophilus sabuli]
MRAPAVPIALTVVLLAAGCGSTSGDGEAEASVGAVTSAPDARLTLVADEDAAASAASTSRALFDSAEVAVVARDGDDAGTLLAASAAVGLGVPLLVEPADGGPADVLTAELDRLGTTTVLAVGDAEAAGGDHEVLAVPAAAESVAAATGLDLAETSEVDDAAAAAAVAGLDGEEPVALLAGDEEAPADDVDRLPGVERAAPLDGTLVLATGSTTTLAGIATARAAGARVHVGGTDPRADADLVGLLGEDQPQAVLALGPEYAAEEGLDWKLETAATGRQLPGGGQLLFPGHFLVALYGHPGSGALGVLGEQDAAASVERARAHAAPYEELVPDATVVPAFEIIATVASEFAGPDGNYSVEVPAEELRPWVEAAGEAGLYVVLDLQPGRTDFVTQAEQYRSLLELPHVGLALDPEWRLGPGQVHLTQIGSVSVDEVNRVVTWLADLTRAGDLPQKLLVLHQFRVGMIPERERLDTSRDELAVMVHADGQGGQGDKQATWQALRQTDPDAVHWGWKNFYDEDAPMLSPEETIAQVSPRPHLISYQ